MIELRTLPVYDERRLMFAQAHDARVLVYWPHGLGDFVHFGTVVPQLEPSNEYFITRFGDDFVHLFDGAVGIAPLYSDVRAIGDGAAQGARHLGIEWKKIRNRPAELTLPQPLAARMRDARIDTVLYTDYPEPEGRSPFPFHTKVRALLRKLVAPQRLATLDLARALPSALRFDVPTQTGERIEERLRGLVGEGDRLYLLAPGGHTTPAKAWPQAEIDAFVTGLSAFDARGRVLTLDEPSMRAAFGDLDVPFAHLLATLLRHAHATIGVSAGPLHAAMAMRNAAVVGIWLAHHPDWYDEFYAGSLHLTGPLVTRKALDRRPASRTTPPDLRQRVRAYPDRVPGAADAFEALAQLLR